MFFLLRIVVAVCLAAGFGLAGAASDEDSEVVPWQENDVQFPASSLGAMLLPFYVSAATDNQFFIDASTLSVGSDGVVRYLLKVVSSEGAATVSFEGMRCDTRERRLYASGRADGTWSKSRNASWFAIRDAAANRHYAALYLDYFCPSGVIVRAVDEALKALRDGGRKDFRGY